MRLGVNIDHVATLRNARGGVHPCPIKAAKLAQKAGADIIVAHLREDRRHIKELDIDNIIQHVKIPLQIEIAPTQFMIDYVLSKEIKKVCIVPEKRMELTTEGGLNLKNSFPFLEKNLPELQKKQVEVSLFIDPIKDNLALIEELKVKAVEIHTGEFANSSEKEEEKKLFDKLKEAAIFFKKRNISIRAGHGLTYSKVTKIIEIDVIEELNIGHFIIGEALFDGIENVVKKMRNLIDNRVF